MKKKIMKTGKSVIDSLYDAIIEYVESIGGSVAVIGGIAIVEESPSKFKYGVMVRVVGKKPVKV